MQQMLIIIKTYGNRLIVGIFALQFKTKYHEAIPYIFILDFLNVM